VKSLSCPRLGQISTTEPYASLEERESRSKHPKEGATIKETTVGLLALPGEATALLRRHADNSQGVVEGCRFSAIEEGAEYDCIVVVDRALTTPTTVRTDPRMVVYASMEPRERRSAGQRYLAQFSLVIAADPWVRHPNLIRRNCPTWWFGQGNPLGGDCGLNLPFSEVRDWKPPEKRAKRVSIVTSTQNWMPGHIARNQIIEAIASHPVGRFVDVYGRGRLPISDKMEAIAPNRYHLVLENSSIPNYWSEKLSDAYLGYALPIYAGCTNLDEYFDANAFIPVNLQRPRTVTDVITKVLDEDPFCDAYDAVQKARDAVLYEYNILRLLAGICKDAGNVTEEFVLYPPDTFQSSRFRSAYRKGLWRLYSYSRGVSLGTRPLWRLPP
jgi:hypothetical protein